MKRKITKEIKEQIVKLHHEGLNNVQIADIVDFHNSTIGNHLKELGLYNTESLFLAGEYWKWIYGYTNSYQVSNLGRIKSFKQYKDGKILKGCKDKEGYLHVRLLKDGEYQLYKIHRLVASAFISKKRSKTQVNHIDLDKTNNKVNNLEWCSGRENMNHCQFNIIIDKRNTTGYRNISYIEHGVLNKWKFQIMINGDKYYSTHFTKQEAVEARNQYIIDNKLQHLRKIIEWTGE